MKPTRFKTGTTYELYVNSITNSPGVALSIKLTTGSFRQGANATGVFLNLANTKALIDDLQERVKEVEQSQRPDDK